MGDKIAPVRQKFQHQGRTIYEWDQTLDEINIYIKPPEGVTAKLINCVIESKHISIGIKGNPPYINDDLFSSVKHKESFWSIEDGELHIFLVKATLGETWPGVLAGAVMDPFSQDQVKKNLMLERFQMENPGFDFSGAEFSGQAPDPKTFMGGISHK